MQIDFRGERNRCQQWQRQGNKPAGRPNFVRDFRDGKSQLGKLLSPDLDFTLLAAALTEQGPEGRAIALMLAVAIVSAGAAALTSHPVSADTGFGHSYIGPGAAANHPAVLPADCDIPVKRADILAVTSAGAAAEVTFNDGLKAMPSEPSAADLACRFRQIALSVKSGELKPYDVETERHLAIFFGRDSDSQLLADIRDWNNLAIDPAEAAGGGEMGLILVDRSKNIAESLLEQISFFYARANGYEARPGAPSRGAIVAYTLLNDIFGFAGEFDSTIRSTCVTHQDRAASRFSQPTVVIDRAVWTPRIAVGSERSIFRGNPELRSADARIGMLFREIIGKSNVGALIRSLRAENLAAVVFEISKGKFLVVAGFDPESENVDFPGLKNAAAGDQDSAHGVGDGAWMVRCGPAAPKPTETPAPTPTPSPQPTARPAEAVQPSEQPSGQPPEATQSPEQPPGQPPSPPEEVKSPAGDGVDRDGEVQGDRGGPGLTGTQQVGDAGGTH